MSVPPEKIQEKERSAALYGRSICTACRLHSRCVTGNYAPKNVECSECHKLGVQIRRKLDLYNGGDDTFYPAAPCLPYEDENRILVVCKACQTKQLHKLFS